MTSNPTKLLLLHHYRRPLPAVDESEFRSHGACRNTAFHPDGHTLGSGTLEFGPNSVVKVPPATHWERLRGVIIDVMVRLDGDLVTRRNLVEADGCFALYVGGGGDLRFDLFSQVTGQTVPTWNGVSALANPTAVPVVVAAGRWTRLRAAFDGITTARLWVDGTLVARRTDFRTSLGTPGGAGVSIGNWTLSNAYPLLGALDWVAIWKLNEDAITKDFVGRGGRDAEIGWGGVMACLNQRLGGDRLAVLTDRFDDLFVRTSALLADADADTQRAFSDCIRTYQRLWNANEIDDPAYAGAIACVYRILTGLGGPELAADFREFVAATLDVFQKSESGCYARGRIDDVDPKWRGAISTMPADTFL